MQNFTLTAKQIADCALSADDFSLYAGIPVQTFCLSQFPHWNWIVRGFDLTEEKLEKRAIKMFLAIYPCPPTENSQVSDMRSLRNSPLFNDVREDASATTGTARIHGDYHALQADPSKHFITTIRFGMDHTHTLVDLDDIETRGGKRRAVFPCFIEETPQLEENLVVPYRGYVLRDPSIGLERTFGDFGLPRDRIVKLPCSDMRPLICDLHEARHFKQLWALSESIVPAFYREVDADWFTHYTMSKSKVGLPALQSHRDGRYIRLLSSPPEYWIAPTLDHLERGKQPPSFYQILDAVIEIRARLMLEAWQIPHKSITSSAIQHAVAIEEGRQPQSVDSEKLVNLVSTAERGMCQWFHTDMKHRPEIPLTMLRSLLRDDVFTEPLARTIAQRIIKAARRFNRELVEETRPIAKANAPEMALEC